MAGGVYMERPKPAEHLFGTSEDAPRRQGPEPPTERGQQQAGGGVLMQTAREKSAIKPRQRRERDDNFLRSGRAPIGPKRSNWWRASRLNTCGMRVSIPAKY
jgi:hypothetical protein